MIKSMTTTIPTAAVCAEEKQSSSVACEEDMQGSPAAAGVVVGKAASTRTRAPKPSASIDDPLFFAKLNLMSKRIAQDARRCKLASLAII